MKHHSPNQAVRIKVPAAEPAEPSAALRRQSAVPAFQNMTALVLTSPLQRPVAADGPPIQRTVTQILPGEGNKINKLLIVGRPERVFGNSMGDHTTAFATHVEAIKLKMENKTLKEALAGMLQLYADAQKLPGYALKDNLPKDTFPGFGNARAHGNRLESAESELVRFTKAATDQQDSDQTEFALTLQDCVNAYLEFRELIPLSAVNVMSVAPALAGKGKGESGHASALALNETEKTTGDKETMRQAILGTFDAHAAALVVSSTNASELAKLAPGVDPKTSIAKRIEMLALQHLQAISSEFPKSFKDAGMTVQDLGNVIFGLAKEKLATDRAYFQKEVKKWTEKRDELQKGILAGITKGAYYTKDRDNLTLLIGDYGERIKLIDEALKDAGTLTVKDVEVEAPTETEKTEETTKAQEREEEGQQEEERKQPIATQIVLKRDTGGQSKIGQLRIAGRPPSPLPGTMGAHTTAWVLHVDRISQALSGQTIEKAWGIMGDTLVPEAEALAATLKKGSPPVVEFQEERAGEALKRVKARQSKKPEDFKSPSQLAFTLQQYVNELFTYINYIPGVTREAANTDGRGEAKYRRYLGNFEAELTRYDEKRKKAKPNPGRRKLHDIEYDEIGAAIKGLLDLKGVDSQDAYKEAHNDIIGKVYPKTWFAYSNHNNLFV